MIRVGQFGTSGKHIRDFNIQVDRPTPVTRVYLTLEPANNGRVVRLVLSPEQAKELADLLTGNEGWAPPVG